jgi:hypothetical protein
VGHLAHPCRGRTGSRHLPPHGPNTWVTGINNLGDFVGSHGPQFPGTNGFVSHNGVVSPVLVPGATGAIPFGIAWDGTIVGIAGNRKHGDFGFLRGPAGRFKLFTIAGSTLLAVRGINNVAPAGANGRNIQKSRAVPRKAVYLVMKSVCS